MKFEVGVCREVKPDFFSRLIMRFTGRNYSHAFVIVDDLWVYDATEKGIKVTPMVAFLEGGATEIVERVEVKPRDHTGISIVGAEWFARGWLEHSCGTAEYSLVQCACMIFPFLRQVFLDSKRKTICSEYVAEFLRDGLKCRHVNLVADCRFLKPYDVLEIARSHALNL